IDGLDPDTLNELVDQVMQAIQQLPGVIDVNNSNQRVVPEYDVNVDLPRAADLGVSAQTAGSALATAVSGQKVSEFQRPGQSDVDIRLIGDDGFRASSDNLASLPLLTTNGSIVRLSQIATITRSTTPTQIAHDNRLRSVTVGASPASGYTVGAVQSAVQQRLGGLALPPGYSISYSGQAATGAQTFGDIVYALGAALMLMYVLMALLFDSLTLPLAVLMSVPLAVGEAHAPNARTSTTRQSPSFLGGMHFTGLSRRNTRRLA